MRVSAYIIGKNCELTLAAALESVYSQSRPLDEIVYLDDGSTDGSVSVAQRYLDRGLILLRNETTLGIPSARNRAVRECKSDWIAVLDADDRWHHEKNARQLAFLESHPDVGLLGTFADLVDENGVTLGTIVTPCTDEEIRQRELVSNCFVHSSVVFRRDIFNGVGGYADLAAAQDYDLMLKLSEVTRVCNLPEPLTQHRIGNETTSVRKRRIQRSCAAIARSAACLRRGVRPSRGRRLTFVLHSLYSALVQFNPRIHWGVHLLLADEPAAGRALLSSARSMGMRSLVMAMFFYVIPDGIYRLVSGLSR